MTSNDLPKKKLPVTKILIAATLLLMVFVCGGGFFYVDYHSGSLSSTFLPAQNGGQPMEVSAHIRGFSGGGTRIDSGANAQEVQLLVGEQKFTVSRQSVTFQDQVVKLPANTATVEIDGYRGNYRVIADGKTLKSIAVQSQ